MTKLPPRAVALAGGVALLALGGCSRPQTAASGVPFPAPQAAPSAQAQIQQIENDPHIPAANKPGIEAAITQHNAPAAGKTPANGQ